MAHDALSKAIKEGNLQKVKYLIEEENAETWGYQSHSDAYKIIKLG
jgi:hypothetical protein